MYKIPKADSNEEMIKQLKKELLVTPLVNSPVLVRPEPFPLYCESNNNLYVPFNYCLQKKIVGKYEVDQRKNYIEQNAEKISISFSGELRDYQEIGKIKAIKALNTQCGALLALSTGAGKTILALSIIASLKLKTLVIVNKEFLKAQWCESVYGFLNGDCTVSFIQGEKVDTSGTVVIAMINSMAIKKYPQKMFSQFGLCIVDEVHRICARTFSRAITQNIHNAYVLGLSATPKRADGVRVDWVISPITYTYERVFANAAPIVHMLDYSDSKPVDFVFNRCGTINQPQMVNNLVMDEDRNTLIIDALQKIYENESKSVEERHTLVCSARISHLQHLQEMISENEILNKIPCGFAIGGMKQKTFDEVHRTCRIILASVSFIQEGYSHTPLNTIILTCPMSNITQIIGRVLRKVHRVNPLIIDIRDVSVYCFQPASKKRISFYEGKGYGIFCGENFDLDRLPPENNDDDQPDVSANGKTKRQKKGPVKVPCVDFNECLL